MRDHAAPSQSLCCNLSWKCSVGSSWEDGAGRQQCLHRHMCGCVTDLGCQELLAGPLLWQWLRRWPEHEQEPAAQEGPRG